MRILRNLETFKGNLKLATFLLLCNFWLPRPTRTIKLSKPGYMPHVIDIYAVSTTTYNPNAQNFPGDKCWCRISEKVHLWSFGHFTKDVSLLIHIFNGKFVALYFHAWITTKCYTCHDSCAVMACANFLWWSLYQNFDAGKTKFLSNFKDDGIMNH